MQSAGVGAGILLCVGWLPGEVEQRPQEVREEPRGTWGRITSPRKQASKCADLDWEWLWVVCWLITLKEAIAPGTQGARGNVDQ